MTVVPRRVAVLVGLVALAALGAGQTAAERTQVISVPARQFPSLGPAGRALDVLLEKDGRVFIVASPEEIAALAASRVAFRRETDRFAAAAPAPSTTPGGLNGAYHSAYELEMELRRLEAAYPERAAVRELGRSLEGRPIYGLKVSDNPAVDEDEPAVLLLGCHHAREWISVEVPLLIGRYLLENAGADPAVRALVDGGELWLVPLVNPDGLEYSLRVYRYWRKNRRANADGSFGVDLNRNYGYMWGFDDSGSSPDPASGVYRGAAPFSEPETDAVRRLFLSRDFRAVISYHSFSQVLLYPWGYANIPTPQEDALAALARAMAGLIAAVRGTVYATGRASAALYVTNGDTIDWTFGLTGIPSFTIELPPVDVQAGGFFNAESDIDGIFRENLPAALYLAAQVFEVPAPLGRVRRRPEKRSLWDRLGFRLKGPAPPDN